MEIDFKQQFYCVKYPQIEKSFSSFLHCLVALFPAVVKLKQFDLKFTESKERMRALSMRNGENLDNDTIEARVTIYYEVSTLR